ncbi:MAG: hypothetical protein IT162_04525 [Bryobacterales bacterium]|nr:hypothetical protein [Bryobacterales bacterium]
MVLLLVLWIWLALAALAVARWLGHGDQGVDDLLARLWIGVLALAGILLWASLLGPLRGPWLWGAMAILGIAGAVEARRWVGVVPPRAAAALALAVALAQSAPIRLHDALLYHHPWIHWLREYGSLPPGAANFHYRFGFSSSWFALSAALEQDAWLHRSTAAACGFVLLLMLCHAALALTRRTRTAADWFWLGAAPALVGFSYTELLPVSSSPNFAGAAATLAAAWMALRGRHAQAAFCAALAVGIKISLFPLLGFALWLRQPRALAVGLALGGAAVSAANYQTSGCPLYPATVLCDGRMPVDAVHAVATETREWARHRGPFSTDAALLSLRWIPHWLGSERVQAFLAMTALCLALLARRRQLITWLPVLALGGLAISLAAAPDLRFAFGWGALLAGAAAIAWQPARVLRAAPAIALLAALVLTEAAARLIVQHRAGGATPGAAWLWMPPPVEAKPTLDAGRYRTGRDNGLCGAAPLPCFPAA